mgnify:CR=1 FL=1
MSKRTNSNLDASGPGPEELQKRYTGKSINKVVYLEYKIDEHGNSSVDTEVFHHSEDRERPNDEGHTICNRQK